MKSAFDGESHLGEELLGLLFEPGMGDGSLVAAMLDSVRDPDTRWRE